MSETTITSETAAELFKSLASVRSTTANRARTDGPTARHHPPKTIHQVRIRRVTEAQSIAALKLAHPGPASITVILNSDLRLKLAPYQLPHELLARIRVCVPVTLAQIAAIAYILASDASARQSAANPVYLNIILSARQYSMANIGGGSSAGGNEALSVLVSSLKAWNVANTTILFIAS